LSSFSSAFNGHILPHLLDVPVEVDRDHPSTCSSLVHILLEGYSELFCNFTGICRQLSAQEKKRRPSTTTGTGAGPEGTILIANVVLSMPKQRWMTIQMLI